MRTVFIFVKYNGQLVKNAENLTEEEKKVIYKRTDPVAIRKFTEKEKRILGRLERRFGRLAVAYAEIETDALAEVDDV